MSFSKNLAGNFVNSEWGRFLFLQTGFSYCFAKIHKKSPKFAANRQHFNTILPTRTVLGPDMVGVLGGGYDYFTAQSFSFWNLVSGVCMCTSEIPKLNYQLDFLKKTCVKYMCVLKFTISLIRKCSSCPRADTSRGMKNCFWC